MTNEALMTVRNLTGDDVVCVDPDVSLVEVASALVAADIGAVVVGSSSEVKGIVSERDLVRAIADGSDLAAATAASVATTELVWADGTASVDEVAEQMMEHWVRHVLVEEGGALVGMVSARDVLGALTTIEDDD
jgi:CBS domain-containing protein